mgnify:FL=1
MQETLQRYNQLQDIIAILGLDELSEDDRTRIYLFGGQIRAWKPPGSRRNVPAKQIWGAAKPRMRETAEIPCISTLGGRLTFCGFLGSMLEILLRFVPNVEELRRP